MTTRTPLTLAVVGTGPRGVSVLERLAVRLDEQSRRDGCAPRPVRIYAIDAREVGAGRIWRTDQSPWYTMNTVAGQVTMYSGGPDGGPARPGAGPSLGEWLAGRRRPGERVPGPDDYAPRAVYGQYLRSVHRAVAGHLPPHAALESVTARVLSLTPADGGGYRLGLDRPPHTLLADRVLLATGHPLKEPDDAERALLDFARRHPGVRYVRGDSAADLEDELDETRVPPGAAVGVRGLGLSFHDVLLTLTVGRGGRYARDPGGALRYLPSGREPRIVAGSRGGLPIPARGRNEKSPGHRHQPLFLTAQALAAARARRARATGDGRLDFAEDVLPPLLRELDQVYWTALVRARSGPRRAARFAKRHAAAVRDGRDTAALLAREGLGGVPGLDPAALARPFAGEDFTGPGEFRDRLLRVMERDLAEAALGNVRGPRKAALDVLRDLRSAVRDAVDHGGLLPGSHRDAFAGRFLPLNSLLSAGPPAERVEQLHALIRQGLVEIAGPETVFAPDPAGGGFLVSSPRVRGSARTVAVLVDARIPTPDLRRDTAPLIRGLLRDGLIREFVTVGTDGERHRTGGLDVTPGSGQVVDAHGEPLPGVHALGIPTEHTRWFTQVGSGRPGAETGFHRDADRVAAALLLDGGERRGTPERGTPERRTTERRTPERRTPARTVEEMVV
ncbi:FAD/NAD(P)-binding protein [Streptomyces jumonjinensis]|uniref:FAD/NAD(P)-binding protein n=1 Tax=Streptomyces jumonjinensis TaxID=1945 RepID=A0A646KBM1_STRJU|nr:FAD/NAD(P)-binding protein [Streptomyces jumonjinensis]MQS99487.1 FAD/NAD(P)-binding protein [Streptomyces jumonjinensis]